MCYDCWTKNLLNCSVQLTLTRFDQFVTALLDKMQGNIVEKGKTKGSICEILSMILDYKNKLIFMTLIFQDVIHFTY